jgi:DNA replication protein DnaC
MEGIQRVMAQLQERVSQAKKGGESTNQQTQNQNDTQTKTSFECTKCEDRGLLLIKDENGNEFARQCECAEWRKVRAMMKSSDITAEFQKLGFGNFETEGRPQVIKDAYESAKEYYMNFDEIHETRRNSIALLGKPGSGKTHLLMAISNNLMKKKTKRVLYFPFVEGMNDLKSDFDKLEEKLHRMKKVDVLFIDDLFKGRAAITDFTIEQMYGIINYRYLNHKPLLVSSEKFIDDLVDIDEALASRIIEMSRDYCVHITGEKRDLNYRLRGIGGE